MLRTALVLALWLVAPRLAAAGLGYRMDPPDAAAMVDGQLATTTCTSTPGLGRITAVFDKPTRLDEVTIPHDLAYVVLELDGGYVAQDYGTAATFQFPSRLVTSVALLFNTDQPICFGELELRSGNQPISSPPRRLPQPVTVSTDVLARATDSIRALRLSLEECDPEAMSWWIDFPITIGARTYEHARALSAACTHGQIPLLDPAAHEAAFNTASTDENGTLHIALDSNWRFAWLKGQWWLIGVD